MTRRRGSSLWFGGQKNDLRNLRNCPLGLVRPSTLASTGSVVRGDYRIYFDLEVRRVHCRECRAVKRERLEFLVENALHTQRFARYVGRRCRSGTIKDVAAELHLDWHTVKRLEKQ